MYLLVEKGEIYEPYTCMVLYHSKDDAIKDLQGRIKKVKKEYTKNYEMIEESEYFYMGTEYSVQYIEISILEMEEGKETCL